MSTPSTPRTARSASPANSPKILTPGQKIKTMLAEFESDSESDNGMPQPQQSNARITDTPKNNAYGPMDLDDPDSEDDDIVKPKGRMAARLQAQDSNENESAFARVSKSLRTIQKQVDERRDSGEDEAMSDGDDDDLPVAGSRRKVANAQRVTEHADEDEERSQESRVRAFSPLFVSSPTRDNGQERGGAGESDPDEDRPKANSRFLALVAQKRQEREEKERVENEKRAAKAKQREQFSSEISSGEEENDDSGRKLSQRARPARKASKKALEEMNRETQRISRSMQLAHQAQTKKKITKESFFARFNFMQPEQQNSTGSAPDNSSTTADSRNSSDAEAQKRKETPHTSPVLGPLEKPSTSDDTHGPSTGTLTELPTLEEVIGKVPQHPEQLIVGRVEEQTANKHPEVAEKKKEKRVLTMPPIRVRLSRKQVAQNQKDDSDSDLEIVTSPAKCRRYAAFENLPGKRLQESSAMLKLKALAQLTSPPKSTMNSAELSAHLLRQARQQANKERQERIEQLRAQGIIIETAEQRAAMEDELENLVEKARNEAEEIAKREKAATKGKQGEDDEHDDDYEFSDSEEDEEEDKDEEGSEEGSNLDGEEEGGLFDSEAGEDEEPDDGHSEVMSSEETNLPTQRRKRPTRVISDEEDEEDPEPKTPVKTANHTPAISVERPHIPGPSSNDMMSLTQAFAGTLADNRLDSDMGSSILHSLPDPIDSRLESDSQMIIKDSQEQRPGTADLLGGYAQSDTRVSESPAPRGMSEFSQIPDPTQDAGFVLSPFDPSKRFLYTPASTVDTVLINRNESQNSPTVARKAKHLRRGRTTELSIIEEQSEGDFEIDASAFEITKKASKKPSAAFDKNKSKAKEVVEEAAEESDDEYAGLGGVSDDEDDEENVYDRQMINDNSGETVDEKQLAALNALHQRNADEKQVAKLLKDITTGALRRRRGGGDEFDLDDSDDELLARRREKQREFARMRKALMADEKIGEIADNPKKAAFFKAIEDRDMDDDDLDFLDDEENPESQGETSSQDVIPDSQPDPTTKADNKRKRPLEPSAEVIYNRPPPHMRRKPASAMSKKPATLAEIRETVSFLTETPEYDSFHEDASVDEDDEQDRVADGEAADEQESNSQPKEEFVVPRHPRRTRGHVVDRLALLRQASSNSATSASSNTRFAFQTGSGPDLIGFRPPLLRKTSTTGSSATSSSAKSDLSRRVTKPGSGASAAKKGAVNYYTAAREKERERELRSRSRNSSSNITALVNKHASNRLGTLGRTGQWD
ncbi:MRC1-like domain-containing protein [Aspergillus coremiiformis]|uniref:MRC1-like domain-containing protein n=1 Tax=Aspergillus coremiiformis TaxID=138285 RepID=A0A5N6ZIK1_9EURO|nr:MRC1-like domain-containing protein [Aspergillus coremiiformis]